MNHRVHMVWQWVALLIVWGFSTACSVPTGDNWGDFLDAIRNMPSGDLRAAKLEEARNRSIRGLSEGHNPGDVVANIDCEQHNPKSQIITSIRVRDVLACMSVTTSMTWHDCVLAAFNDRRHQFRDHENATPDDDCNYLLVLKPEPDWDPDNITEEDLARTAVQSSSPPAWMIAAGIVVIGAGGIFVFASGWAAILCPADVHYACDQSDR